MWGGGLLKRTKYWSVLPLGINPEDMSPGEQVTGTNILFMYHTVCIVLVRTVRTDLMI